MPPVSAFEAFVITRDCSENSTSQNAKKLSSSDSTVSPNHDVLNLAQFGCATDNSSPDLLSKIQVTAGTRRKLKVVMNDSALKNWDTLQQTLEENTPDIDIQISRHSMYKGKETGSVDSAHSCFAQHSLIGGFPCSSTPSLANATDMGDYDAEVAMFMQTRPVSLPHLERGGDKRAIDPVSKTLHNALQEPTSRHEVPSPVQATDNSPHTPSLPAASDYDAEVAMFMQHPLPHLKGARDRAEGQKLGPGHLVALAHTRNYITAK